MDNYQVPGVPDDPNRLYAGLNIPVANRGVFARINAFKPEVAKNSFSVIELAVSCPAVGEHEEFLGVLLSVDRINIEADGYTSTPPELRLHVEYAGGGADAGDGGTEFGWMYREGIPVGESGSEFVERNFGLKLSPEEKIIADSCPRRPWSKNVPDRACKKDGECGDGFCDRGRCSAIFTCMQDLGSRCEEDDHCPYQFCIDGRCRSCVSDEECEKRLGTAAGVCGRPRRRAPGRECALRPSPPLEWKSICESAPPDERPDYCDW